MSTLQAAVEGSAGPTQDPWDWTVDEVIFSLTNGESPLRKANSTLSLPETNQFANILRKKDVNGLALLTEVMKGNTLRDDLEVKSMGHRAGINQLIRQLQDSSAKYYHEYIIKSARVSSFGIASRFGTPSLTSPNGFDPQYHSNIKEVWPSPKAPSSTFSSPNRTVDAASGARERPEPLNRDILAEAPRLPPPNWPVAQPSSLEDGLGIATTETVNVKTALDNPTDDLNALKNGGAKTLQDKETPTDNLSALPEQHARPGEVTITDELGRERRRLVLAPPDPPYPSKDEAIADIHCLRSQHEPFQNPSENIVTYPEAEKSFAELQESTQDLDEPESISTPGVVILDDSGRKRTRPILIAEPAIPSNNLDSNGSVVSGNEDHLSRQADFNKASISQSDLERIQKKVYRTTDQAYLGPEALSVDEVFYGDSPLESLLHNELTTEDSTDDFENFNFPSTKPSSGLALYISSRMKYFLQSQRMMLQNGETKSMGIIPYPGRIGRKHHPLSMTVFTPSTRGVFTIRSNRSKWIQNPQASAQANVFNVADPTCAQDEQDDPEWKTLEKWKYMSTEDKILPIYGDSGSEGEYELDTWKEIEEEQGSIARPSPRPSRSQKLLNGEVNEIIDIAVAQTVKEWDIKRKPKLQANAWRWWAKSRRNNNARFQIDQLTQAVDMLDSRLRALRKEITGEEWSRSDQLSKQCNILQPSIFDREDSKWKITLLASHKVPEKIAHTTQKPRKARELTLTVDAEDLADDADESESSDGNLDGFIVSDESEADHHPPINPNKDTSMMTEEDAVDSGIATEIKTEVTQSIPVRTNSLPRPTAQSQEKPQHEAVEQPPSKASVIDLTLDSDALESEKSGDKPDKPTFDIKTPPVNSSGNESEVFQRSRKKKAVFKRLSTPKKENVIDLESDSSETAVASSPSIVKASLPQLDDVRGISAMDASVLVERQDRKRLLTWVIAHAPSSRREAALSYLTNHCLEKAQLDTQEALKRMRAYKRRMSGMDNELSDCIMSIASWQVCWTIPVKTDERGLKLSHIDATLADIDGFDPFHGFLLDCLSYCQIALDSPVETTPTKKRQEIVRDPEENHSSTRKRKFHVNESQETVNKRQAAKERMLGDVERRREEQQRRAELAPRLKAMGSLKEMGCSAADTQKIALNPGKLEDQEFVYLNSKFGHGVSIKEHQIEGLRFLWREITGDHDELQGCLLAQTMGLGKTMQVIALLVALADASQSETTRVRHQVPPTLRESQTLILCPPALLENWWDEFLLWAPRPFSFGELRKVSVSLGVKARLHEIHKWSEDGGILLIGYDTFKNLIHNNARKVTNSKDEKKAPLAEGEHETVRKTLLQRPTLVVADEAHTFKVRKSQINSAINRIKTPSRIALSGSPLNNNLEEYYTLVDWIAPNYLGTHTEFKANYQEPIEEGLYVESTKAEYHRSRTKLKALEIEMEPKVHRANVSVLQRDLQGKLEFVIRVPLTTVQEQLYNIYVSVVQMAVKRHEPAQAHLWTWLGTLQLLCNHPQCFRDQMHKLKAEAGSIVRPGPPVTSKHIGPQISEDGPGSSDEDAAAALVEAVNPTVITEAFEKCEEVFQNLKEPSHTLSLSNKIQILMKILELSNSANDKVLVFSHRLNTLDYVQMHLEKNKISFARIDGGQLPQKRQPISKGFNEGNVNVCLISTRAGGTGLNLYGANRVVILDEHFNPAFEMQAVGRAYRLGQKKIVYVYRLTAAGTFEQALQNQALFKEQLADRVVDKRNPSRSALKGAKQYLFPVKSSTKEPLDGFLGKDPSVLDHLLADHPEEKIISITPSETLHIEDDMPLTEEMALEAQKMVESEQLRRRDPQAYSGLLKNKDRPFQEEPFPSSALQPANDSVRPWNFSSTSAQGMNAPCTAPNMMHHMGGLPYPCKLPSSNIQPMDHDQAKSSLAHSHQIPNTITMLTGHSYPDTDNMGSLSEAPPQTPWSELNLSNPMASLPSAHRHDSENRPGPNRAIPDPHSAGGRSNPPGEDSSQVPSRRGTAANAPEPLAPHTADLGTTREKKKRSPILPPSTASALRTSLKDNLGEGNKRKHSSQSGEPIMYNKKRKPTSQVSPGFNSLGDMESRFQKLLDKENARSSK